MTTWYIGRLDNDYVWYSHEYVKAKSVPLVCWEMRRFADDAAEKIGEGAFAITITY